MSTFSVKHDGPDGPDGTVTLYRMGQKTSFYLKNWTDLRASWYSSTGIVLNFRWALVESEIKTVNFRNVATPCMMNFTLMNTESRDWIRMKRPGSVPKISKIGCCILKMSAEDMGFQMQWPRIFLAHSTYSYRRVTDNLYDSVMWLCFCRVCSLTLVDDTAENGQILSRLSHFKTDAVWTGLYFQQSLQESATRL